MPEIVTRVHGVFSAAALSCVHLGPAFNDVELYWIPESNTGFGSSISTSHVVELLHSAYINNQLVKVSFDGNRNITMVEYRDKQGYAQASPGAALPAGPPGPPGPPGANGAPGTNGTNGSNGANGSNGSPGVSVTSVVDRITGAPGVGINSVNVAALTPQPAGTTTRRVTVLNSVLRGDANAASPIIGVFQSYIAMNPVAGAYPVTVYDPSTGSEFLGSGADVVHLYIASFFSA